MYYLHSLIFFGAFMRLLAFFCLALIGLDGVASDNCESPYHCQIIVDAGSTGSRAFLYRYQSNGSGTIKTLELLAERLQEGGLSSLNEEQIPTYFRELVDPLLINSNSQQLPISVLGTAGMRLLSEAKQEAIYQRLMLLAEENSYDLREARTISGKEEGLFAWLGVNAFSLLEDKEKHALLPVMDFGGASTQIAYQIPTSEADENPNALSISWGAKHYSLVSISFLGLGLNDILHQYMDNLHCFSQEYPLSNGQLGDGQWALCRNALRVSIDKVHQVSQSLKGHPVWDKRWAVLGAMPYLIKALESQQTEPVPLGDLYESANQSFCNTTWDMIKTRLPNETNYSFAYCFNSSYFYALLHDAYHLSDKTELILPSRRQYGWTAGALLFRESGTSL